MTATATPTDRARAMLDLVNDAGGWIVAKGDVVTVEVRYAPGDVDAYEAAYAAARRVLGLIRQIQPGTVWGSDPYSVGGHAAMTTGAFHLSKSGVERRVLNAIRKQQR